MGGGEGGGEKLTLYQGFGKQRQNTFRELRIFFMDLGRSLHFLGRTDTPWGPHDIRWESLEASTDNSADAFICKNFACCYDTVRFIKFDADAIYIEKSSVRTRYFNVLLAFSVRLW